MINEIPGKIFFASWLYNTHLGIEKAIYMKIVIFFRGE